MKDSPKTDSWDASQPRRAVAISFIVALVFGVIVFYPYVDGFLLRTPCGKDFWPRFPWPQGWHGANPELRHSGAAN